MRETEVECAFREFREETRMSQRDIHLFTIKPFIEVFRGSNGKMYSTHYFVAYCGEPIEIKKISIDGVRTSKETVSEEINDLKWENLQDTRKRLNSRRQKLLEEVHNIIISFMH